MSLMYQLAGGGVSGRDHRRGVPRNNQDAYFSSLRDDLAVVFVADGCGSGGHSEVGAHIGVRLMADTVGAHLRSGRTLDAEGLLRIRDNLAAKLRVLALSMGESLSEVVNEYFLFTMLGAIITPSLTTFIAFGDGVIVVNGEVIVLEPQAGNRPAYLSYLLTGSDLTDTDPDLLTFRVIRELPTEQLDSFLVGTDGVCELIERASCNLPGMSRPVGELSQFWTEDVYFDPVKPKALTIQLNLAVRDRYRSTPSGRQTLVGGLIGDDVTFVVGRRTPSESRG